MDPYKINYPNELDTEANLFVARDSLVLSLARDYNVGDIYIYPSATANEISNFPPQGIITLTSQNCEVENRATSFYYELIDTSRVAFGKLTLLPDSKDAFKPAIYTTVSLNVSSLHHNNLKDAIKAIENFVGLDSSKSSILGSGSLIERSNYLDSAIYVPKAWFQISNRIGLIPMSVDFTSSSFRLGEGLSGNSISYFWNFGDGTTLTTSVGNTTHVYENPGIYDVSLTVTNSYGEDTVVFPSVINAKVAAPDLATIQIAGTQSIQAVINSIFKSPSNVPIQVQVPSGTNPSTGKRYDGAQVNGSGQVIDPIKTYVWDLSDDLDHGNSHITYSSYTRGGIYDVVLRLDTLYNDFRITVLSDAINIVEPTNLFFWMFPTTTSNSVNVYEFGFLSRVFKTAQNNLLNLNRNSSFLQGTPNSDKQIYEFNSNVGFATKSSITSGQSGSSYLFWASGRNASDPTSVENIYVSSYVAYLETYTSKTAINRPWNWLYFNVGSLAYFSLGLNTAGYGTGSSPTNLNVQSYNVISETISVTAFSADNFLGSASDLMQNPANYSIGGANLAGDFSIYRSVWFENNGYVVRDQVVGDYFYLRNFYGTTGTGTDYFTGFRKLTDVSGDAKSQGRLVALNDGVYFFNNSPSFSFYSPAQQAWYNGNASASQASFKNLQDSRVLGYEDPANTLLATSDNDHDVYLSFDYSANTFVSYNNITRSFVALPSRPKITQWNMSIY